MRPDLLGLLMADNGTVANNKVRHSLLLKKTVQAILIRPEVESGRCGRLWGVEGGAVLARIMVVDDEEPVRQIVSELIRRLGHDTVAAANLAEARRRSAEGPFDAVLLDVHLPDGDGLDFIPEVKDWPGSPEVVVFTGLGSPDGAELAITRRAWDYIEKPVTLNKLALPLSRLLQYRRERTPSPPLTDLREPRIIGGSSLIRDCLELVAKAAASPVNVLLAGATGTGKELFALAIHNNSHRKNKPFVVLDCAALPETLVESLLFGHAKGAFTGADSPSEGLIKQADGGTLFLDEIGDLPLNAQRSFLRVLQERRFRPVGGDREKESDFRLIAATHQNLELMVEEGRFRSDLLFRLKTIIIKLPPLNQRNRDILEIARYHLAKLCAKFGSEKKEFSPEFAEALTSYHWPGNVRELVNTLEWSLATAGREPTLFAMHLPEHIRVTLARSKVQKNDPPGIPAPDRGRKGVRTPLRLVPENGPGRSAPRIPLPSWKEYRRKGVHRLEAEYLVKLVSLTGGDMVRAGEISGIGRSRLYQLLREHGLSLRGDD